MAQTSGLEELLRGAKGAWEAFVRRYAGLIVAAVRGIAREAGEVEDLTQEVFLRLCKDDFRLLRSFDPTCASRFTGENAWAPSKYSVRNSASMPRGK